jgi:hypothetical protein
MNFTSKLILSEFFSVWLSNEVKDTNAEYFLIKDGLSNSVL